jgi:hypothetical protein
MEKCCTKCKNLYPATNDYFYNNIRCVDGFYSWCKECYRQSRKTPKAREYAKQWYNDNLKNNLKFKEEQRQRNKIDYQIKKEEKKKYRESRKEENKENQLKIKFGINLEEYNNILEKQNHCCDVCGLHKSNFTRQLAVDHCHTTGKIRGLLCSHCNLGLGKFKDNINYLQSAINYLQKHN